jgi:hypothetical protein
MECDTESWVRVSICFDRNVASSWSIQPLQVKALRYCKMSGNTYLVTQHHI